MFVCPREEQEKKNVWLAYLNMETTYGDSADVKKLLERAVTYNDPLDIYLKMCEIYISAGKMEVTIFSSKFNMNVKKNFVPFCSVENTY